MMLLLKRASLLVLLSAFVEGFENVMEDDEMYECCITLLCSADKVEEFYQITKDAGPEHAQKYVDSITQVADVEFPENTLEYWNKFKDYSCQLYNTDKEKARAAFMEWCTLVGEYILDVCKVHDSQACITADIAADRFASVFMKYKALGVCASSVQTLGGMMKSPFG